MLVQIEITVSDSNKYDEVHNDGQIITRGGQVEAKQVVERRMPRSERTEVGTARLLAEWARQTLRELEEEVENGLD